MIDTVSVYSRPCACGNGYYEDRYVAKDKRGCPACDPELGQTTEMRMHNYRKLVSTPVKGYTR